MVGLADKKPIAREYTEGGSDSAEPLASPDATSSIGSEDESGGYFVNEPSLDVRAKTAGDTQGPAEPSLGAFELETGQVSAHDKEDSSKALLFVCLGLVALLAILYVWV